MGVRCIEFVGWIGWVPLTVSSADYLARDTLLEATGAILRVISARPIFRLMFRGELAILPPKLTDPNFT